MLNNIQALRAIAAYLVVMSHASGLLISAGLDIRPIDFGASGVDIFFVISGFIMVYTTRNREVTPQGFMLNRIIRIVPLYWAVTFAVFAVALVAPWLLSSTRAHLGDLLMSLFFIPFQKGSGNVQPVVYVGWTLNYEMFFYALFALGLFLGRRGIPAVLAALVTLVALRPFADGVIGRFYTDPILLEFGAGMILGWAYDRLPTKPGLPLLLAGAAGLASAPWLFPDLINWGVGAGAQGWLHRALVYGIPAFAIVAGGLMLERAGRTVKWLNLLGDASYSIYLTHFFVVLAARKVLVAIGPSVPLAFLFMFASLVAVAIVGIAVHLHVEKPLSKLAKRAFRGRQPALAPA